MFDPVLLNTFVAVAQWGSFSEAGRRLGLGQSTVSEHVRRLEAAAGRRMFVRDTHRVVLTPDGDAMLGFAKAILDANEHARRHFSQATQRQCIRLGATENFVRSSLPAVLKTFQSEHPEIDLALTVGLSVTLFERLDLGELDLVLGKRMPGEKRGEFVCRDRMVWIGSSSTRLDPLAPVPLVMYPPPAMSRTLAIEALDRVGRAWHVVCTCDGLMGLRAATLGGYGVMVQPRGMIPAGLEEIAVGSGLPEMEEIEFVVAARPGRMRGLTAKLAEALTSLARAHVEGPGQSAKLLDSELLGAC